MGVGRGMLCAYGYVLYCTSEYVHELEYVFSSIFISLLVHYLYIRMWVCACVCIWVNMVADKLAASTSRSFDVTSNVTILQLLT